MSSTRRYLPHEIGDGEPATLYLTRHPGFVSTLAPNPAINVLIHSFADLPCIAPLKIDIQGGELTACRAGCVKPAQVLCRQTAVAFTAIYRDQPLLADQDAALRSLGCAFAALPRPTFSPFTGTPQRPHCKVAILPAAPQRSVTAR